jgi:hypothetical protein
MKNRQLSAAVSAITLKAKLAGLWLEKRENPNRIDIDQLTDAELVRLIDAPPPETYEQWVERRRRLTNGWADVSGLGPRAICCGHCALAAASSQEFRGLHIQCHCELPDNLEGCIKPALLELAQVAPADLGLIRKLGCESIEACSASLLGIPPR